VFKTSLYQETFSETGIRATADGDANRIHGIGRRSHGLQNGVNQCAGRALLVFQMSDIRRRLSSSHKVTPVF